MLQHTVEVLLKQEPGAAICDSCLGFACSTSLEDIRVVTAALVEERGQFQRGPKCESCRRTVPSTLYKAPVKCAHCSDAVYDDEAVNLENQTLHVHCFRRLLTDDTIRISRDLSRRSRQLIAGSRERLRRECRSSP